MATKPRAIGKGNSAGVQTQSRPFLRFLAVPGNNATELDNRFMGQPFSRERCPPGSIAMNLTDAPAPPPSVTCHDCGSTLSEHDPLGGGLCDACLWRGLSEPPADGESPYRDLVPGHEIIEELGRGGMGVVYRARQQSPAREVALKMLLPLDSGHFELRERFRQEARTLAELEHPAILPLYQVGEADGVPYFTMKLAAGGTLARRLAVGGAFSARRAAELVAVLAEALQYAHTRGVIHRDLKPGNVLFDDAGRPYLADFGLAKLEDALVSFSRSAGVLGTPAYLAPEIAASGARAATTSSDIYSLGAVLYEVLTGRPPFAVEGLAALLVKIAEESPPTPTSLNAQVPRDLEIVCLKCLRKAPADRYVTAADLAEDLRRWLRGEPVRARQFTPVERLVKWARRRPALAGLSAALAVTAIGSSVWLTHSNRELNKALRRTEQAQAQAAQRADFFLGKIADQLEALGRLDILDPAYVNALETETGVDEASRHRRARLLTRWGRGLFIQNRHDEARAPLAEAVRLAETLAPGPDSHVVHAEAAIAQATLVAETGSFEQAVGILSGVEERVGRSALLAEAGRRQVQAQLAEAYVDIGLTTVLTSRAVQEQAALAVAHRRALTALTPGPEASLALAAALRLEGETIAREARDPRPPEDRPLWEKTLPLFEEALKLADDLARTPPVAPAWRREQALNMGWLAEVRLALDPGAADQAVELLEAQVRLLEEVCAGDPGNWFRLRELCSARDHLADHFLASKEAPREDAARLAQDEVLQRLQARNPAARSWLFVDMNASFEIGQWHLSRQRIDAAEKHFERAWRLAEKILVMRPNHLSDFAGIRTVSEDIRKAWQEGGRPDKAKAFCEKGLAFALGQAATSPQAHSFQWFAAHFHRRLAGYAAQANERQAVLDHNLASLELRAGALRARALSALDDPDAVPNSYLNAETAHLDLGQVSEAVALAKSALALRREVADLSLNPNPWATPIVVAVTQGVEAGGETAVEARRLAALALTELYPAAVPGAPTIHAGFQPRAERAERHREEEARHIATLKELAGPELVQKP
jgi:serine/threonine protein kinase